MILEDGCFILSCISQTEEDLEDDQSNDLGLKRHQISFIHQDIFLLEDQVPYMVLEHLMDVNLGYWVVGINWLGVINRFIRNHNFMASERVQIARSYCWGGWRYREHFREHFRDRSIGKVDHLLALLYERVRDNYNYKQRPSRSRLYVRNTYHNVNDLLAVGITFRPSKTSHGVSSIRFKSCGLSGYLELPAITVDDSTVSRFVNMLAYEMTSNVPDDTLWVTSYICFLDSLIYNGKDVKVLRKAGILTINLRHGSDEEVTKLFKEISAGLETKHNVVYADIKSKIQQHCDHNRRAKTWATQLKQEYFKSPWTALALVGAIVALVLSGVQAYFTVWATPGECDHLCKYLKQTHHL